MRDFTTRMDGACAGDSVPLCLMVLMMGVVE